MAHYVTSGARRSSPASTGIRTGLTKVGFPGAPMGLSRLDPTIGGLLRTTRDDLCRRASYCASHAQHHPTPRGHLLTPRPRGRLWTLRFARRMAEPLRYLRRIRAI